MGKHVTWMLDFLHARHSGEDTGLWPFPQRDRAAGVVLIRSGS